MGTVLSRLPQTLECLAQPHVRGVLLEGGGMNRKVVFRSVILVLVAIVAYGVVRLSRGGYLPVTRPITASPAPTSVPLHTAEAPPLPAPTATESQEPVTVATGAGEPVSTLTAKPTEAPTAMPTRVVQPPEAVQLPDGFGISVFASGLSDPRMMTLDDAGHVHVAERGDNRIVRLPDRDGDGVADGIEVVVDGLSAPSSIAFHDDGSLYVGETRRVLRVALQGDPAVAGDIETIVDGLPSGGHNTRTVRFSPDGAWLYVSVGSSCNTCIEEDPLRAAVVRYRPDGREESLYATGLRNAVGMAFRPGTSELWVTNNGADWLGDDQPPETVYRIKEGDDAGWPRCHSGRIIDPQFGAEGACDGVLQPEVEMQAHSAPLGLTFYSGTQFPERYQGSMFVAFHGSWNREEPTGYKVVFVPLSASGAGSATPGPVSDFAAGWLRADGSLWGRPVDVLTGRDGSLLISDDFGGRIYRVFYASEAP